MLDSDSFSIVCSFLRQPEILSFSFCNKMFFKYYKNHLHPEVKEMFLRYGCKQYCEKYYVVTRFSKYEIPEDELFLQACFCGNYLLVEDLLKKKVHEKYDFIELIVNEYSTGNHSPRTSNNAINDGFVISGMIMKNKKVFLLLVKEMISEIIVVARWILKFISYDLFHSIVDDVVDIIPEDADYEKLLLFQEIYIDNFRDYKEILFFSKLITKKKALLKQNLKLFKVTKTKCIYCLMRTDIYEKILFTNKQVVKEYDCICEVKNIYNDEFDPEKHQLRDNHCSKEPLKYIITNNYSEDNQINREYPEINFKSAKDNLYEDAYYVIRPSNHQGKIEFFVDNSCQKIEKKINNLIKENKEFIESHKSGCSYEDDLGGCSLCEYYSGNKIDYHCNLVKYGLKTKDSSRRYDDEDEDDDEDDDECDYAKIRDEKIIIINDEINGSNFSKVYKKEYCEKYHYKKKIYSIFDAKNIPFEEQQRSYRIGCCNKYIPFEKKNKLNILETFFDPDEIYKGKDIYSLLKEKFSQKKDGINFKFMTLCYCGMTKDMLSKTKKNEFVIIKMIEKNMKLSDDDYAMLIDSDEPIEFHTICFPPEEKLKLATRLFTNIISEDFDRKKLRKTKKKFASLKGDSKITNENKLIELFLEKNTSIFDNDYIVDYIDYSEDDAEAITKIFMKRIRTSVSSAIINSPLTKFILDKELSRKNPSRIILENTYCAFYARNIFKEKSLISSFPRLKDLMNDEKEKKDLQDFLYLYTPEYFLLQNDITKLENIVFVEEFTIEKNLLLLCKKEEQFILFVLKKIKLSLNDDKINFLKENKISRKILKYFFYSKHDLF